MTESAKADSTFPIWPTIVIVGLVLFIGWCTTRTSKTDLPLEANISFDGTRFSVKNESKDDWRDVSFIVNDTYKAELGSIPAGQTYGIGFLNLATSQGERFNPVTHKVLTAVVVATMPDGRIRAYGGSPDK